MQLSCIQFLCIFAPAKKTLVKKFIFISFISLSNLLLLIMTVVPHHHHEGLACMIIEICDEDNIINDEHTSHNTIPFDSQQKETCVADAEYTVPQSHEENQCKVSSCTDNHIIHLFPLYYLAADNFAFGNIASGSGTDYGKYIVFYTSAEANHFNGLRGPPYIHV